MTSASQSRWRDAAISPRARGGLLAGLPQHGQRYTTVPGSGCTGVRFCGGVNAMDAASTLPAKTRMCRSTPRALPLLRRVDAARDHCSAPRAEWSTVRTFRKSSAIARYCSSSTASSSGQEAARRDHEHRDDRALQRPALRRGYVRELMRAARRNVRHELQATRRHPRRARPSAYEVGP